MVWKHPLCWTHNPAIRTTTAFGHSNYIGQVFPRLPESRLPVHSIGDESGPATEQFIVILPKGVVFNTGHDFSVMAGDKLV